jgi:quercetin dioxygenase-like cupin family protein
MAKQNRGPRGLPGIRYKTGTVKTRSTLCPGLIAALVAALEFATQMSAEQMPGKFPGGCAEPPRRPSEIGCYLSAIQRVDKLPDEPLFWHLYTFSRPAAAAAAKAESLSTVAESLDKVWLFTIASAQWRPAAGERVAVIGPLPLPRARQYIARYMEATFPPNQGMVTTVHRHSGPEAWYVLTGAQCLRTPENTVVLRSGEGGFVPPGPPMVLTSIGPETRRALFLVLHDASEPWQTNTTEWTPTRECPAR